MLAVVTSKVTAVGDSTTVPVAVKVVVVVVAAAAAAVLVLVVVAVVAAVVVFRDKNQLHTTNRPRQLHIHAVSRSLRASLY